MFVTVQGCAVHEHPRAYAYPERRDARRARTRGGLLFGYFLLATQEKVTRAARRADRKLWLFASSDRATRRNRGKGVAHGGPGPTLFKPLIATRLLLSLLLQLLRAGARALPGAPGERREAVDQPAGSPAGMPAMFVTVQGCAVHEHPRAHAYPERRDARRARTRGGLLFGYFPLATQEKVTRAARRADRKLWLFAWIDRATGRSRGKGGPHGGPEPTLWRLRGEAACNADRKFSLSASSIRATERDRGEGGARGGPGPTLWRMRVGTARNADRKLLLFASTEWGTSRPTAKEPSRHSWRDSGRALRPALTPTPLPAGEGLEARPDARARCKAP
jgi:hypothetical protein